VPAYAAVLVRELVLPMSDVIKSLCRASVVAKVLSDVVRGIAVVVANLQGVRTLSDKRPRHEHVHIEAALLAGPAAKRDRVVASPAIPGNDQGLTPQTSRIDRAPPVPAVDHAIDTANRPKVRDFVTAMPGNRTPHLGLAVGLSCDLPAV
jgi:hypothetical protein